MPQRYFPIEVDATRDFSESNFYIDSDSGYGVIELGYEDQLARNINWKEGVYDVQILRSVPRKRLVNFMGKNSVTVNEMIVNTKKCHRKHISGPSEIDDIYMTTIKEIMFTIQEEDMQFKNGLYFVTEEGRQIISREVFPELYDET